MEKHSLYRLLLFLQSAKLCLRPGFLISSGSDFSCYPDVLVNCQLARISQRACFPRGGGARQISKSLRINHGKHRVDGGITIISAGQWCAAIAGREGLEVGLVSVMEQMIRYQCTPQVFWPMMDDGGYHAINQDVGVCLIVGTVECAEMTAKSTSSTLKIL